MVAEIVKKVVEETGGPVTEVKVYNMIQEKRETDIKKDIEDSDKRIKQFVNRGVCVDLAKHVQDHSATKDRLEKAQKIVDHHVELWRKENDDHDTMTAAEE